MAKKKVIDADVLLEKVMSMSYRNWAPNVSLYGDFSVPPNASYMEINNTLRNVRMNIESQVRMAVDQTMRDMIRELCTAVMTASRDEHDGMCGLCRVDPNQNLPDDFRPKT